MVNPHVFEFFTGTECCESCWYWHRQLGLPCSADYACCGVLNTQGLACGVDPDCTGGDGGDDAPGPDGDDEDDNCDGMDTTVSGWSIDIGGAICKYDGAVTYVNDGTGECVPVASDSGVVYDCVSTTTGGPIDNEPEVESENGF